MPSLLPAQPTISHDADQALTMLIDLHLRSNGVTLDPSQIAQIKQEGPVLTFLHSVVDLGRRKLARDTQTEPLQPHSESAKAIEPAVPATGVAAAPAPESTPQVVLWVPPDLTLSPPSAPASSAPIAAPDKPVANAPPPASPPQAAAPLPQKPAERAAAPVAALPSPVLTTHPAKTAPAPVAGPAYTMPPARPPAPAEAPQPSQQAAAQRPAPPPPPPAPKPLPKLRLPNATAETPFSHTIDLAKVNLGDYKLVDITGTENSGLVFNAAGPTLHGTPTPEPGKPHEYTFIAKLQHQTNASGEVRTTEVALFVNPHPRTLWKEVEPDATLPFQKPHRRSMDVRSNSLRAVAASVRGRSHAQSGSFREDDFHIRHDISGEWTVIAVSDGAGSAKMSRRGSQLATEVSVDQLAGALPAIEAELAAALPPDKAADLSQSPQNMETARHLLLDPVGRAAFQASKAIQAEAANLKVEEKALSATLLLAAMRKWGDGYLVASYWIGDGAAAAFDQETGTLHLLGDADSGEYSGQTRFLLSSEFGAQVWDSIKKRFRCRWVPQGSCLVLMSDGVSDPKFGTDNALKDPDRWTSWWRGELAGAVDLSRDNAALPKELETYLGFWSQGEHDDRTLALVY